MQKADILNRFVAKLSEDSNVLAVILFGSFARGNSRPTSDIDLVVVLNEGYKRVVEVCEGQAFEIIYTTEGSAKEYWLHNRHDAVGLWSVARVIYDRDGTGQRLEQLGKELIKELPPSLDALTLAHIKFDIEDSLNAVEALIGEDATTASLLLHKKTAQLVELYFDLSGVWRPAPKQQLGAIRAADPELAHMVEKFYSEKEIRTQVAIARTISARVLEK